MSEHHADSQELNESIDNARRAVWTAYVVLLALLIASGIWHYLQGHAEVAALLVRILPLILFLPTLLLKRRRGHIWLTALGVLYAVQGILIITEGGRSALVFAEVFAATALSVAAFYYARFRGRLDRRAS